MREPRGAPAGQISLSTRTWMALIVAFLVITLLLVLTAVTLISQRQRTVLLNKQLGSLVTEATLVLGRARPTLNALPASSSTVASRASSAAALVTQASSLIRALRAGGLPDTVSTAGQLLRSIDQPGALAQTLGGLDTLATDVNRAGLVSGLMPLISEATSFISDAERTSLVAQALHGISDLDTLVDLQRHTLHVQEATLQNGRRTRALTAQSLATARRTATAALELLAIARQTLTHVESLDRKVGPVP